MAKGRTSIHKILTGVHLVLAVSTVLPTGTASKPCLLGYNAHCSFTPISTVCLVALAGLHVYLHRRGLAKKAD